MKMTPVSTPYWFALVILLHGAKVRPASASCRKYWSSLMRSGENLLHRLHSELEFGYSDDPPSFPKVSELVKYLYGLGDQPLAEAKLNEFQKLVDQAMEEASPHIGANP